MNGIERPTKEQVRNWLAQRRVEGAPLQDPEQIRHQLGWKMCTQEHAVCAVGAVAQTASEECEA